MVLYQVCYFCANRISKMATMTWLSLTLDPMGISHFHLFFWNHKTDLNQTWQKCSLDGHIQFFVFGADRKFNMAARAHNVFWLVEIIKPSCQKVLSQLNYNIVGTIIGWSCTKLVNRLLIGNSRWPPWLDLVLT